MQKNNFVAIVQVRMGSHRLPGKSAMSLGKFKIIDWVIKRVKKAKLLDQVVIATSNKKKDKIFRKIAKKNKIKVFYGSEDNVLKRFCDAGKKFNAKNVIRICADRPFISPEFIDDLILFYKKTKCDLAFNHIPYKRFKCVDGLGAEIFSLKNLQKITKLTKKKSDLEHVTQHFYLNKKFKVKASPVKKIFRELSYFRLDLDIKEDLLFFRSFVKKNKIHIYTSAKKIVKGVKNVTI